MSIKNKLKVTSGCLTIVAGYAFASYSDEKARIVDDTYDNSGIIVQHCHETKIMEDGRDYMGCAP